ncbi:MAG TPA: M14 family metallopeptidase [Myxococcota bacterium]|jgi:predicted deacylase|nr:M14 family metallopeptidase [Myxococcota bacterium]
MSASSHPVMLRMTAPARDVFDVPYHELGPASGAPAAALVAGIHGNELNGIFVLARLASFLRRIAEGERAGVRLLRRVLLVPAVNVLGVNLRSRRWPFDGTDVNRMFPGYGLGETTQRIAAAVLERTAGAEHRLDLHSSNLDFEELPQVRLYEATDGAREAAGWLGLPAVVELRGNPTFTTTLGHAWRQLPGVSLVVQAGQAGVLQGPHCERLFRGLLAYLVRIGAVAGLALPSLPDEETHRFGPRQAFPVFADHAGWFVPRVEVGRWLPAGATLGFVYDGFDGELRAEVRAPVAGLLTGIRRSPLLYQGDLVARLHTTAEHEAVADTFLHGHGQ